jgi:hypothetical protein
VRLAAAALGEHVDATSEVEFATTRMVFVELCPYPSRRFGLSDDTLGELASDDAGFEAAARVRRMLIEEARPALIMINGAAALRSVVRLEEQGGEGRFELTRRRYASESRPEKELWHEDGGYTTGSGAVSVPVVGFPFLRKPRTHNSYVEIDQLGAMARALVVGAR